jgi:hypothetical protein
VEDEALMPCEPGTNLGMLMGRIIVEDDVNDLSGRNLGFDGIEEPDELLMRVALHATADHLAFEHVESGEQRGGAMTLVVMGHGAQTALLHRQARLGAVERLDLALLIEGQDNGVGGRIDIKAHHIAQFLDELGIVGELELTHPVRLQPMRAPDALNRTDADADLSRHQRGGPMGGLGGRIALGQRHDPLGDIRPQRRNPRGPRLVAQQPIEAFRHKPFLLAPDAGFRGAGLAHDLVGADAIGGQKDDLGPPHMLLRAVAVPGHGFQAVANGGCNNQRDSYTHPTDSHAHARHGIPAGIQMSDFIH